MNSLFRFLRAFQGGVGRIVHSSERFHSKYGAKLLGAAGLGFFVTVLVSFATGQIHPKISVAAGFVAFLVLTSILFAPPPPQSRGDIRREGGRGTNRRTDAD